MAPLMPSSDDLWAHAIYPYDAAGTIQGSVEAPGYPEALAFDGKGSLFVASWKRKSEIADFDGFLRKYSIGPSFVLGDCSGNGEVAGSVTDAVALLDFAFLGNFEPRCVAACDADGDGEISVTDAIYLLDFCFLGGSPPPPPYPECRPDGATALECREDTCP